MQMTNHANARAQQRGIKSEFIDLVLEHGDENPKPGNVIEYRISKRKKNLLITELKRLIQHIEKASGRGILVDPETGDIITVYNIL